MINEKKIDSVKHGKPFNLLDIVIFVAAAALIVALLFVVYREKGAQVEIVTPQRTYTYSLQENRIVEVDGHLTVVIENGSVYVRDADCPDKVCEHTGAIRRVNQIIACMPNGVVIRITGLSDSVEVG